MASISSLMGSSSSSSIYGTRNVISGLASGLDTEALIENAVSGYTMKITALQQDRTKVGWKQDAYRSMIDKMVGFTQKYTSYTSSTNLLSSAFFDGAVKVKSLGEYAEKVVASGKTNSNVELNSVTQLAQAAQYRTKGCLVDNAQALKSFDLGDTVDVGQLSGTMTLGYGGRSIQISFDESDIFANDKDVNGKDIAGTGLQKMVDAINKKLENETIAFDGGTQTKASERIRAVADGDSIKFETVKKDDGNGIWISDASSSIKSKLGISIPTEDDKKKSVKSFNFNSNYGSIVKTNVPITDLIADKGFSVTVNGSSKTIKGPSTAEMSSALSELKEEKGVIWDDLTEDEQAELSEAAYIRALNKKLSAEFTGVEFYDVNDKSNDNDGGNNAKGIQLGFRVIDEDKKDDFTFQVTSTAAEQLGMESGLTSYINTSRKLSTLLPGGNFKEEWRSDMTDLLSQDEKDAAKEAAQKGEIYKTSNGSYVKEEDGKYYQVNSVGEYYYDIKINGKVAAIVTEDTTMEDLLSRINNSDNSEIKASYSSFTNKFAFTTKETGAASKVEFDGLMSQLFDTSAAAKSEKVQNLLDAEQYPSGAAGQNFSIMIGDKEASIDIVDPNPDISQIVWALNDHGKFADGTLIKDSGYKVTYSEKSGELVVTKTVDDKTENMEVSYNQGIAKDLFDAIADSREGYSAGQDAHFIVTVNGETKERIQASNTIDIDGMSMTLKGTFNETIATVEDLENAKANGEIVESVTFQTDTDTDKIVDAIKQMVTDFNAMAKEIKDAYSTVPLQRANGKSYEPLTEEDQADMSESAIKAYEEKAKTGLLFADRDLASLYEGLRSALSDLGISGNDGKKLGITSAYSNGLTTISLDESALRNALASDPDKVKDLFTRSKNSGSSSDGIMQKMKNVLDKYAGTTGAVKGILVEKAGSPLAPTSIYQNTIQKQLDNLDKQIEKWQGKISDQIDYYTKKFTALEKLMAQMNNQSGMLMGLSGGY